MDNTDNDEPRPETVLTEEQRAAVEAWLQANPYGEQDENGIDLSAIRRNLRLSPTERLARLQQAADSLYKVKNAATRH
jgi:hypothetical protein